MELAADVVFLVLSSVNNDLFIHVFVASVGCHIRYIGITEMKNILYISACVACTMNFSVIETLMIRLKIWMSLVLKGSKHLT